MLGLEGLLAHGRPHLLEMLGNHFELASIGLDPAVRRADLDDLLQVIEGAASPSIGGGASMIAFASTVRVG